MWASVRERPIGMLAAIGAAGLLPGSVSGQEGAYPMSRCVFRLPYANSALGGRPQPESIRVNAQNVIQFNDHNGTDITGEPPIPFDPDDPDGLPWPEGYAMVAVQDGVVRWVEEGNTGCCWTGCGDCNNRIVVEHVSGDFTAYAHIAPDRAEVDCGDAVVAGQLIAIEGDTGRSCGGSSSGGNNRLATGCNGQGPDPGCPYCGVHLHMSSFYGYDPTGTAYCSTENPSGSFAGQTIPVFCNIVGNVLTPGAEYPLIDLGPCGGGCVDNILVDEALIIPPKGAEVVRANVAIQASDFVISGPSGQDRGASVSFRAGETITLQPGFRAEIGSYFLGIISDCDGCPPPRG